VIWNVKFLHPLIFPAVYFLGDKMSKSLITPNAGNSILIRLKLEGKIGILAEITKKIADLNGILGAVETLRALKNGGSIRDLNVFTSGTDHANQILEGVKEIAGSEIVQCSDRTFRLHEGGKIEVNSRTPIENAEDLAMAYTPGVGRVCMAIAEDPEAVKKYTIKNNMVAVVTDGTAVLGLGDIGPEAALPVMEGKAMLFKQFAGLDAFPICLDEQDPDEIVKIVKAISPGFGGINLEDISAPRCFEIEEKLSKELTIPVFHDDQHGTAAILTAALINALKIVNKKPKNLKVVVLGAGAAGTACSKMIMNLGVKNLIACDRKGAIHKGREDLGSAKRWFADNANPDSETGTLSEVISGADLFIGLSGPGLLSVEDLKKMSKDPIVFAMANPIPEIMPEVASPYVKVMATGRSDYPNQINNVLCFPGIFKGALECGANRITEEMKLAAAQAIANCISEDLLGPEYIVPSVFEPTVAENVSQAVKQAAVSSGAVQIRGRTPFV